MVVAAVLAFALAMVVVEVVQGLVVVMMKAADKSNQMRVFAGLVAADKPYLAVEIIIKFG